MCRVSEKALAAGAGNAPPSILASPPRPPRALLRSPDWNLITDQDRTEAEVFADSVARLYTDGWHKAKSAYLTALAVERGRGRA